MLGGFEKQRLERGNDLFDRILRSGEQGGRKRTRRRGARSRADVSLLCWRGCRWNDVARAQGRGRKGHADMRRVWDNRSQERFQF